MCLEASAIMRDREARIIIGRPGPILYANIELPGFIVAADRDKRMDLELKGKTVLVTVVP
jgi:hypothetical protein